MKLFFAIGFENEIKIKLNALMPDLEKLPQAEDWRFEEKDNYHLTLLYLGDTYTVAQLDEIAGKLEIESFELSIDHWGTFLNEDFGVVWAGVGGQIDRLEELKKQIDLSLDGTYRPQKYKAFRPHITVAYTAPDELPDWHRLELPQSQKLTVSVTEFHLFIINELDGGQQFKIISSYPLKP